MGVPRASGTPVTYTKNPSAHGSLPIFFLQGLPSPALPGLLIHAALGKHDPVQWITKRVLRTLVKPVQIGHNNAKHFMRYQ